MANHVQDQILAYYVALLTSAGTSAGSNVALEQLDTWPTGTTAAIELEAGAERIETDQGTLGYPRVQMRYFDILIHCTVVQTGTYRTAAGTLAKQVEAAICASLSVQQAGGLCRNGMHLQGSEVEKDGAGDRPVYSIVQRWTAGYTTRANAPDVPL